MCSLYALGWVRLECIIEIRKILFIRNVLALDDDEPIKIVFRERALVYFENPEEYSDNIYRSPTVDLLQAAQNFGMLETVKDMIITGDCLSKPGWKRTVWARAWDLESVFLAIQSRSHESLMLLDLICHSPRYLVWWSISDKHPEYMGDCEVMAKLICKCSMTDDIRLKNTHASERWCEFCNLHELEDARHLVLRCQAFQSTREAMISESRL